MDYNAKRFFYARPVTISLCLDNKFCKKTFRRGPNKAKVNLTY